MEQQQQGFSDSTPKAAGSDDLKIGKQNMVNALQLIFIIQISTQKYESGIFLLRKIE